LFFFQNCDYNVIVKYSGYDNHLVKFWFCDSPRWGKEHLSCTKYECFHCASCSLCSEVCMF